MTDENRVNDPLRYLPSKQWSELGENMEPDWEEAHKPHLKTEVLTVRLGEADMQRLRLLAEKMGVGHSTLARMILRKALQEGSSATEEAVASSVDTGPWVQIG